MADTPSIELDDAAWERLARHVAGEGSASERSATAAWVAADPARERLLAELTEVWDRTGKLPDRSSAPIDVDAAWARMSSRIAAAQSGTPVRSIETVRRMRAPMRLMPMWAMAASLLLLVGGSFAVRALRSGATAQPAAVQSFATAPGERRSIVLDDSSEVILGVASRLAIASDYGSSAREVTLSGEALFRVRHDAARPFRVRTANAMAEDLGTEFTVRAYAADEGARVVVHEGLVAIRRSGNAAGSDSALVSAGQTGTVSADGATRVTPTADSAADLAWTRGELVFNATPLRDVVRELERWYAVTFAIADSAIADRRLTTSFASDPIADVLRVIEETVDIRAERDGQRVTLRAARPR